MPPECPGSLRTLSDEAASLLETFRADSNAEEMEKQLKALRLQTVDVNVWDNPSKANQLFRKQGHLEKQLKALSELGGRFEDLQEFVELALSDDPSSLNDCHQMAEELLEDVRECVLQSRMQGKYDTGDCIIQISAGAGGEDSMDWTRMLVNMYTLWAQRRNWEVKLIEERPPYAELLKRAAVQISGSCAFGHCKAEIGVHRLVRYSPFSNENKRHTSFASVLVLPCVEAEDDVEFKAEELKIETMRSQGAGGQHVNKTESAVRVTHFPTGLVATCQTSRSQHDNKKNALALLKARVLQHQRQQKDAARNDLHSGLSANSFGSQIRSYVLDPQRRVTDHRTNIQAHDARVDAVLQGDLDMFVRPALIAGNLVADFFDDC